MSSTDEPDFGFLNDEDSAAKPADAFSFDEPPTKSSQPTPSAAEPAAQGEAEPERKKRTATKSQATNKKATADESTSAASVKRTKKKVRRTPETQAADKDVHQPSKADSETVPKSRFLSLAAYAILVTLVLLLQFLGFIQLGGGHQLESLPDVAPLKTGEFQLIPETASLPAGHELKLGQEVRFGDIIFTPAKVVREPITFEHMTTGKVADDLQKDSVLKLYFTVRNASSTIAFPPWDVALMSHRSPMEGLDATTKANSWLMVDGEDGSQRILNFFHSPKSSFEIVGLESRRVLQPDESRSTFIASSQGTDEWLDDSAKLTWRIQLRKGVHPGSSHSVTTLIDVLFSATDIEG